MKVFPVVHITEGVELALEQSQLALESGSGGVYLIDHKRASYERVEKTLAYLRRYNRGSFVGVNFLHVYPTQIFERFAEKLVLAAASGTEIKTVLPDSLWVDDCSVSFDSIRNIRENVRPEIGATVAYAGGVAHKYTFTETDDPFVASEEAKKYFAGLDIVVTTGPSTGMPPSPAKIEAMKAAIGDTPLAIASGITANNVSDFKAADQVFVASSIETEKGNGIFDPAKLQHLINVAHNL